MPDATQPLVDPRAGRVLQATGQLPRKPAAVAAVPAPAEPPSWTIDEPRRTRSTIARCTRRWPTCWRLNVRVQFAAAEDLFRLLELPADLGALWFPHLIFHWYGDAPPEPELQPLDLNNAAPAELQNLNWPEQRLQGFLRERRLQGFRDLADLQERLSLPPSAVEVLIGKVCFRQRRANPSLPPRRR